VLVLVLLGLSSSPPPVCTPWFSLSVQLVSVCLSCPGIRGTIFFFFLFRILFGSSSVQQPRKLPAQRSPRVAVRPGSIGSMSWLTWSLDVSFTMIVVNCELNVCGQLSWRRLSIINLQAVISHTGTKDPQERYWAITVQLLNRNLLRFQGIIEFMLLQTTCDTGETGKWNQVYSSCRLRRIMVTACAFVETIGENAFLLEILWFWFMKLHDI
jgi:hypothetical protein